MTGKKIFDNSRITFNTKRVQFELKASPFVPLVGDQRPPKGLKG
jgi:hypothetical protein